MSDRYSEADCLDLADDIADLEVEEANAFEAIQGAKADLRESINERLQQSCGFDLDDYEAANQRRDVLDEEISARKLEETALNEYLNTIDAALDRQESADQAVIDQQALIAGLEDELNDLAEMIMGDGGITGPFDSATTYGPAYANKLGELEQATAALDPLLQEQAQATEEVDRLNDLLNSLEDPQALSDLVTERSELASSIDTMGECMAEAQSSDAELKQDMSGYGYLWQEHPSIVEAREAWTAVRRTLNDARKDHSYHCAPAEPSDEQEPEPEPGEDGN